MAELSNYKVNLTHQAFFSGGIESMYAKFGLNYPERTCHRYVCMNVSRYLHFTHKNENKKKNYKTNKIFLFHKFQFCIL